MADALILDSMPEYLFSSFVQPQCKEYLGSPRSQYDILYLALEGEFRFQGRGEEILLSRGQWYIHRERDIPPLALENRDCRLYAIYFHGQFGDAIASGLSLSGSFPLKTVVPMVEHMARMAANPITSRFLLICDFYTLCASLLCASPPPHHRATVIAEVHAYIRAHFAEEINIANLAAQYGYSADYLSRKYQKTYGVSPASYMRTLRIQQAMRMLAAPGARLQDVAEACGYCDYSTFYRAFLAHTGVAPNRWSLPATAEELLPSK